MFNYKKIKELKEKVKGLEELTDCLKEIVLKDYVYNDLYKHSVYSLPHQKEYIPKKESVKVLIDSNYYGSVYCQRVVFTDKKTQQYFNLEIYKEKKNATTT
jgi:hypothetical protein